MHSIRASMQSVTAKRLSTEQHRESLINSSSVLGGKLLNSIMNNSVQMTTATTRMMNSNNMTSQSINNAIAQKSIKSENYVQMGNYDMLSFKADSLDGYDNYAEAMRVSSTEHKLLSNSSTGSTFQFNGEDCIAEDDELRPALPIKKRSRLIRKDRLSTYDNVDETDDFPKLV